VDWLKGTLKEFYCAFCKTPRKMRSKKHIQAAEVFLSLAASFVLMLLFFQNFDFRVIPIFAFVLSFYEFLIQIQYRLSLPCPHCGFDPLLYLRSHQKACAQVIAHLEKRKQDPEALLRAKPLNLPKIKKGQTSNNNVLAKKSSRLDVRL
jgi:hypothetical protein